MKKIFLPFIALSLSLLARIQNAHALPSIKDPLVFKSQVGLPGMGTSTELTFGSTGYIGQMIKGFYDWGLGVGGILAAIMIMAGGVLWLTSAGSSDMVGRAKKMITGSIVGLLLLVGSWMMLKTINPALLDMSGTDISAIEGLHYCCSETKGLVPMQRNTNGGFVCPEDSSVCPPDTKCTSMPKTNGNDEVENSFKCLNEDYWSCCEYEERNHKKCIPVYNSFCAAGNTIPYSSYDETEYHFVAKTKGYCIEKQTLKGVSCEEACIGQTDGSGCGPQCYCYTEISYYGLGEEGEPCGDRGGSICYAEGNGVKEGKCDQVNNHNLWVDRLGRGCNEDKNLRCCNKEK
ncbi:MAG: pilin [Bacillota bacterium]